MVLDTPELIAAVTTIVGAGFGLLKMTLSQFERRLDAKFSDFDNKLKAIDQLGHDIKRIELEQLKNETKYAITYATKEELMRSQERLDQTITRVFMKLDTIAKFVKVPDHE